MDTTTPPGTSRRGRGARYGCALEAEHLLKRCQDYSKLWRAMST